MPAQGGGHSDWHNGGGGAVRYKASVVVVCVPVRCYSPMSNSKRCCCAIFHWLMAQEQE